MKLPRKRVSEFERRFVAFVDILGFRSLVQRMSSESDLFYTVRDALTSIDLQSRQFRQYRRDAEERHSAILARGGAPLLKPTRVEMTAFSDCYLLSEKAPAWRVVAAVQALGARLLAKGILSRGAVVHGLAYHHRRVVFGPAVIAAYELERDVAKYPRIVVTDSVRRACWDYHEGLCEGRLFLCDVDGCWFVNVFEPTFSRWKPLAAGDAEGDRRTFLKQVRRHLNQQLESSEDELRHAAKVRWAVNYFNLAAQREGVRRIDTDSAAALAGSA